jgi:CheY-like chemotaxis protein
VALKILVAEDSPVDSLVLRNVLTRDGYQPVLVSDGKAALEALEADPEIALAIVDMRMPEMDGLELVREMRARPNLEATPVIFVTTVSDPATIRGALELKTVGYVLKPIREPSRILRLVHQSVGEATVPS